MTAVTTVLVLMLTVTWASHAAVVHTKTVFATTPLSTVHNTSLGDADVHGDDVDVDDVTVVCHWSALMSASVCYDASSVVVAWDSFLVV